RTDTNCSESQPCKQGPEGLDFLFFEAIKYPRRSSKRRQFAMDIGFGRGCVPSPSGLKKMLKILCLWRSRLFRPGAAERVRAALSLYIEHGLGEQNDADHMDEDTEVDTPCITRGEFAF